jgi:hypothetical protein
MYRFKVFTTAFIFLISGLYVYAQEDILGCMSTMPKHVWENAFQDLISDFVADSNNRRYTTYTIPIVFHVIHSGESIGTYPNITLEQVKSQITVLNQDFSGNAYNKAKYPERAFVQWATNQDLPAANKDDKGRVKIADFNIQFCLASKDAFGNTLVEPGINRINYLSEGWPDPTTFTTQMTFRTYLDKIVKPQSIWDVKKYLNVWITDKSDLLMSGGVSTVPPLSTLQGIPNTATDTTDGIWCYTKSIGSFALFPEGQYFSENIDGRTLTHEVGHYVGLRHIWGDANCGNDFCADTPPSAAQNGGNPTFPHNVGSCPSNDPDGEMFMNFMDYTMGASKYMFTTDQMIRAQTAMTFSPFRNQLGTHDLCSSPSSNEVVHFSNTPMLFPNPTSGLVTVRYFEHSIKQIHIYNYMGSYIQSYDTNVFSIEEFPSGMYFVYINTGSGSFTVKLQKL